MECGWLKDKFGLFWQIASAVIGDLIDKRDQEKPDRVMLALLKLRKLGIETLRLECHGN